MANPLPLPDYKPFPGMALNFERTPHGVKGKDDEIKQSNPEDPSAIEIDTK